MSCKKQFCTILFLILILSLSACNQTQEHIGNDCSQPETLTSTSESTFKETEDVKETEEVKETDETKETDEIKETDETGNPLEEKTEETDEQTTVHEHIASKAIKENEIAATCEKVGSYDEVIYCSECGEELSRTTKKANKLSHSYKNGACIHCNALKTSEGLKFNSNGNGTCSLSGIGSCNDINIIVPSVSPSGDKVTAISASAFYNYIELISIRIPDSVTSIGNDAFAYCANMRTVILSNNVTSWGSGVFAGCSSMEYTLSGGLSYVGSERNPYMVLVKANDKTKTSYEVNAKTLFISNNAFASCSNATSIEIGDRVVGIGSCAFQSCSSLVSITLPQNLTEIKESLFSGCNALESVNIPSKVTVIRNNAFAFCKSLKNIELPEGLKKIESSAFYFCSALTEISIPDSVAEIQGDVFKDCSALSSVSLPNRITVLSNALFRNCSSLKSITIPSGVTEIGTQAFENCTSLESIVIPSAVKTIKDNAFKNCSKLNNAQFEISDGWQCFDVNTPMIDILDLSDTEQNAIYLTFRYNQYKWKRS